MDKDKMHFDLMESLKSFGMDRKLTTADQAADFCHVSVAAIRKWTREGCPCYPMGRLRRYSIPEILQWLAERAGMNRQ